VSARANVIVNDVLAVLLSHVGYRLDTSAPSHRAALTAMRSAVDARLATWTPRPSTRWWAVTDMEQKTAEGRLVVLGYFSTEREAAKWIDTQDPAKVKRGGFGLDGPTEG
jgi:hypothetical protein